MTTDDAEEVIARYESGDLDASAAIDEFRAAVARVDDGALADVRDRLLTLIHDGEYGVRSTAATLLATLAEAYPGSVAAVVPSLSAALDDAFPVPERTLAALDHVARDDPGSVVPVTDDVAVLLDDDAERIRQRAIDVLAHVAQERPAAIRPHVEVLGRILRTSTADDDSNSGTYATATGRSDRSERAHSVDREIALLREQGVGAGRQIRSATRNSAGIALRAVAEAEPSAVVDILPELRRTLLDGDTPTRRSVLEVFVALAESDPGAVVPAVDDIVSVLQEENDTATRTIGVHVLATLADDGFDVAARVEPAMPTLVSDLRADHSSTRVGAATLLSYVAERDSAMVTEYADRLAEGLDDDESAVRIGAVWALSALPPSVACEHLADVAESDPDPEVRALAGDRLENGSR